MSTLSPASAVLLGELFASVDLQTAPRRHGLLRDWACAQVAAVGFVARHQAACREAAARLVTASVDRALTSSDIACERVALGALIDAELARVKRLRARGRDGDGAGNAGGCVVKKAVCVLCDTWHIEELMINVHVGIFSRRGKACADCTRDAEREAQDQQDRDERAAVL